MDILAIKSALEGSIIVKTNAKASKKTIQAYMDFLEFKKKERIKEIDEAKDREEDTELFYNKYMLCQYEDELEELKLELRRASEWRK